MQAKVTIIGNLGKDPEMAYSANGVAYTRFSVATNYRKGDDENVEWFNCTAFGRTGEAANEYLSKGSKVYVEGRLEHREYERNDGQYGYSLDVAVNDLQFLDRAPEREPEPARARNSGRGRSRSSR